VVQGNQGAVNPEKEGTKVAAHYRVTIAPGQSATVRLRLIGQSVADKSGKPKSNPSGFGAEFDKTLAVRLQEADEFYRSVTPPSVSPDAANVMRQAIAGMLWSKHTPSSGNYDIRHAEGWSGVRPASCHRRRRRTHEELGRRGRRLASRPHAGRRAADRIGLQCGTHNAFRSGLKSGEGRDRKAAIRPISGGRFRRA
jgi:hypothetical protein